MFYLHSPQQMIMIINGIETAVGTPGVSSSPNTGVSLFRSLYLEEDKIKTEWFNEILTYYRQKKTYSNYKEAINTLAKNPTIDFSMGIPSDHKERELKFFLYDVFDCDRLFGRDNEEDIKICLSAFPKIDMTKHLFLRNIRHGKHDEAKKLEKNLQSSQDILRDAYMGGRIELDNLVQYLPMTAEEIKSIELEKILKGIFWKGEEIWKMIGNTLLEKLVYGDGPYQNTERFKEVIVPKIAIGLWERYNKQCIRKEQEMRKINRGQDLNEKEKREIEADIRTIFSEYLDELTQKSENKNRMWTYVAYYLLPLLRLQREQEENIKEEGEEQEETILAKQTIIDNAISLINKEPPEHKPIDQNNFFQKTYANFASIPESKLEKLGYPDHISYQKKYIYKGNDYNDKSYDELTSITIDKDGYGNEYKLIISDEISSQYWYTSQGVYRLSDHRGAVASTFRELEDENEAEESNDNDENDNNEDDDKGDCGEKSEKKQKLGFCPRTKFKHLQIYTTAPGIEILADQHEFPLIPLDRLGEESIAIEFGEKHYTQILHLECPLDGHPNHTCSSITLVENSF